VNVTARIAEYARQGEELVSQAVADASQKEGLAFGDISPVELKRVSGTVHLLRAHLAWSVPIPHVSLTGLTSVWCAVGCFGSRVDEALSRSRATSLPRAALVDPTRLRPSRC
jgi:hypothetical protein